MGTVSELVEALFTSPHKPDRLEQLHKVRILFLLVILDITTLLGDTS